MILQFETLADVFVQGLGDLLQVLVDGPDLADVFVQGLCVLVDGGPEPPLVLPKSEPCVFFLPLVF
jgi:hypothetical protein